MARVGSTPLTSSGQSKNPQQGSAKPNGPQKTAKSSCYARQQRYREKKRLYVDRLESTVKRLRMDVDKCLIARHNAEIARVNDQLRVLRRADPWSSPSIMTVTEVVGIMRKCMEAFESGMQAEQAHFIESAMSGDVHSGDLVGRHNILEQWMGFVRDFNSAPILENCGYSVECLEQGTVVGHVSATLVVRLTHVSLTTVFPQTLADLRLCDKLLQGPMLRLPMTVCFQFDEHGKVCRYDASVDFVAGLHVVLGDYEDVATTLQSANIDASGQVRGDVPRQLALSSCGDQSHSVCHCRRTSSRLDKLSLAFLLSSN